MDIRTHAAKWQDNRAAFARDFGIHFPDARAFLPPEGKRDFGGALDAMDAQPTLTTTPNSAVPAMLTTFIDPDIFRVLFAANKAAVILGANGERKKGDWTDMTAMFPIVEQTGDVSSYGDYSDNGSTGANMMFPQRQSYHYQTVIQYGEREIAMAERAKVNLASEKQMAATVALNKFHNQTYFFGVKNLQNYGLLNDPALTASIQPGAKAFGAQAHGPWITGGVITATPNEVYNDIIAVYYQLVLQTAGLVEIDKETRMVLAMAPDVSTAILSANSFGVDVRDLLKKGFPNLRIETAVQYDNGNNGLAGNLIQLIAEEVEGQETGYCAFTEKLRAHPLIADMSAWKQKMSQGTWGAIIRQPFAIASMLGV